MKNKIILSVFLIVFSVNSLIAEDTYVFTETQLKEFLAENISEAVEKAVAENTRERLKFEIDLQATADTNLILYNEAKAKNAKDWHAIIFTGVGLTCVSFLTGFFVGVLN